MFFNLDESKLKVREQLQVCVDGMLDFGNADEFVGSVGTAGFAWT